MKTASELRKTLDEALKPDTSGKTTPMQRLTPFLRELIDHLEASESRATLQAAQIQILMDAYVLEHPYEPVSSDAPTQAVPASPTNEPGSASKASA